MTPPNIPLPYRFLFLYFEPFAAFGGTLITLTDPSRYLLSLSPAATPLTYLPLTSPIYDQLSGHLLNFAWGQAIVLRTTSELKVWKAVLFGMFLCDLLHLWASARILGWAVFLNPLMWRWEEWLNFVMLYGPGMMRLGVVMEVGFGNRSEKAKDT